MKGTEQMRARIFWFLCFLSVGILVPSIAWSDTLERIQKDGVMRIGVRSDAAPYSFRDDLNEPAGFIVDLCRAVAKSLRGQLEMKSIRIDYVNVTAENRFDAIRDGSIDLLCGPTSATLSRREFVDFSIGTFIDGASVIFDKNGPKTFRELEGKRIGVRKGTTTEMALMNTLSRAAIAAEVIAGKDHKEGLEKIKTQQIEAYFGDRMILAYLLGKDDSTSNLVLSNNYFSYEPYALALPHGDSPFRLSIDRALSQIYRSGEIELIYRKAFGVAKPSDALRYLYLVNGLPN
jgi:ABC-type amino acid transport substrate-binding protein